MSYILRETPIPCSNCGQNLWRHIKETYDITTHLLETRELAALCRKCSGINYLMALRGANSIKTLAMQDAVVDPNTYTGTAPFGEEVAKAAGRKIDEDQEFELTKKEFEKIDEAVKLENEYIEKQKTQLSEEDQIINDIENG